MTNIVTLGENQIDAVAGAGRGAASICLPVLRLPICWIPKPPVCVMPKPPVWKKC